MSGAGVHFSLFRGGDAERPNGVPPPREIQELWFMLARRGWRSLVIVPADEGISAAKIATALADVGGRLRDSPVAAIVVDSMDYESARMLADLQFRVRVETHRVDAVEVEAVVPPRIPERTATGSAADKGEAAPQEHEANALPPGGQVVVALQPLIVEPLGVAIAQGADAVLLCVEMGRTRLSAARQTIELIGADRIAGACIIR